ncbi:cadherin-like beta sandwich domain-containing protein [Aneurinibacillus sp. REN35]|uniref:cadherin-like beta sandwich domain-containing protein n=1 Tax=Aneurinibacillus sp. REN35 TaxID=3237286 RepID=UPI003527B003
MGKQRSSLKGMTWLALFCMVLTLVSPVQLIFYPKAASAATTPQNQNFDNEPTGSGLTTPQIIGDWTFSMVSTAGGSPKTQVKKLAPNTTNDLLFLGGFEAAANEYARVQSNTGSFKLLSFRVIERNSSANNYRVVGYLEGTQVAGAEKSFTPLSAAFYDVDVSNDSAWKNIDEFRIFANTTIKLEIDDIMVTDPIVAPLSTNADLSNLSLSEGTLSPLFASGTTGYTVNVGNAVSSLTVTPTVADSTATVKVNGVTVTSGNASGAISLSEGSNSITVEVTAQDGTTKKTYTITVTRAASLSTNADLSNLSVSQGTLSPLFASGTASYTVNVGNAVNSIDVTPTVADAGATVTVNGNAATSSEATTVSLSVGSNPITVIVTAANGTTTRTYTVTVTRAAPANATTPNIDTQPTDQTVNVGGSASLSVVASGGVSLSYQWYSNTTNSNSGGTLISGATSATYAAPTGTAGTTYYYVVVTNTDSSATGQQTATATSGVAKVQVNALTNAATPNIDTQPADQTVNVGGSASLSVVASGGASLSYQWYSNTTNSNSGGTLISGATSATYAAPTGIAGTTYYYVVVTNTDTSATGQQTATATSGVAKVQVNALTNAATPNIDTQPADQTVNVGGSASLSVVASGGVSLSYQWYSNTTNSNSGGTLISGATSATYAAPTGTAGTTYYYVVVTNTDSSATGQQTATATSGVAKVQVNALTNAATPNIDTQPADQTVNVGGSASLSVVASGGASLSYQWYSNTTNSNSGGTLISGATSATYAAPTGTAGTTYYYVVVTNTDSSATGQQTATATSGVAKVQVNALTNAATPNIDTQPVDQTVNVGDSASLSVVASGGVSLSYQWYSNTTNSNSGGTLISGATSATYAVPTGTAGTTYYYVVVTNTDTSATGQQTATVTSSVAEVQVNALSNAATPNIDTQPVDQTVNVGDSASLSVVASGGASLSYQWYSNTTNSNSGGTLISGATSATYAAPTGTAGTTYYYVVVTNTDSSATGQQTTTATSGVAKVTVSNTTLQNSYTVVTSNLNPSNQSQTVTFTATVSGGTTLLPGGTPTGTVTFKNGATILDTITVNASGVAAYSTNALGVGSHVITAVYNGDSHFNSSTSTPLTQVVNAKTAGGGGGGGSSTPAQPSTPSTSNTGVEVLVNGKVENAGIATTAKVNGQTVTTIAVDPKKLDDKLAAEGQHAILTIPVKTNADILVGELTGQMVKNMEQKQAVVEIKTDKASYTLPAQQINIDAVSEQIGKSVSLQDIKVRIEISKPTAETVKIVENSAAKGEFTIVAPPVNFTVKGTYGDKTIEVSKFNAYVERTIAIPDGIDPNKITTGVVVEPDGVVRHVPTKVIMINGKYFAKINSVTNSTYSVIWHPIEFKDVEKHWAKTAVNDMGSRMVISGVGHENFSPDQDITRAEFAAIMVRGLGLKVENGSQLFKDVQPVDWYDGAVQTAYKYNLISGFEDGTFRPNDTITREQAMAIIARAMKITGLQAKLQMKEVETLLQPFKDAKEASEWAKNDIADCLQAGLVSGRDGKQLAPKSYITRAEVAVIIQGLLQKSELI